MLEAKPIFLLADSQLLFARDASLDVMGRVKAVLEVEPGRAKAAYLGASNGDVPAFFEIFHAAMKRIGVGECEHVRAGDPSKAFLDQADLILLAGGDVVAGWHAMVSAGHVESLRLAATRGAVLIGTSAGTVQLGTIATDAAGATVDLLSLVPFAIDAHDEPAWTSLTSLVQREAGRSLGLGIPMGGGVVAHPDRSLEAIGKPFTEIVSIGGTIRTRSSVARRGPA